MLIIYFQHILSRTLDAQKFDVNEKITNNMTNRINLYMCKNLTPLKRVLSLDAQKFSGLKISMFTVIKKIIEFHYFLKDKASCPSCFPIQSE